MSEASLFRIWVFLSGTPLLWLRSPWWSTSARCGCIALADGMRWSTRCWSRSRRLCACCSSPARRIPPTSTAPVRALPHRAGHGRAGGPLYAQFERLKRMWLPIGVALLVGSTTAIVSAVVIGRVLGASRDAAVARPQVIDAAHRDGCRRADWRRAAAGRNGRGSHRHRRRHHCHAVLELAGLRDPAVRGFAVGITAHAIGTARRCRSARSTAPSQHWRSR